jgi:hypothetical protein
MCTTLAAHCQELMAHKPYAYYFVVLFSRGMLRDPRFAQILLSTGTGPSPVTGGKCLELDPKDLQPALEIGGAKEPGMANISY